MLESGEDPLYLARRMVRMAARHRLAEPGALAVTLAAKDAFDFLGAPRVISLLRKPPSIFRSPKIHALYTGYGAVLEDVQKTKPIPSPSISATPSPAS